MRYMGGKEKIAGRIALLLEALREPGQVYVEPFVGGASVVARMSGERTAGDAHPELIALYKAVQNGWVPPSVVTEKQYKAAKEGEFDDQLHLKAFIGFGCSFAGSYFTNMARGEGRNYAAEAARSLLKKNIKGIDFYHGSYDTLKPKGALIYCDPPYLNTTGYKTGVFDHVKFWATMRKWSRRNVVVVSEYAFSAPADFAPIYTFQKRTGVRIKGGAQPVRGNALFMHAPAFARMSKEKKERLRAAVEQVEKMTAKVKGSK